MKGSLGRLTSTSSSNNSCLSRGAIAFSTFPGGEGGRGRGRGSTGGPPNPQIGAATTPGKSNNDNDSGESDAFPSGLGHGRSKPLPSNPILPSFSSWMSGINPSVGRGRSNQDQQQQEPPPRDSPSQGSQSFQPKKPIFFRREDLSEQIEKTQLNDSGRNPEHGVLPSIISSGLPGAGRGKSMKFSVNDERANEENRHLCPQGGQSGPRRGGYSNNESPQRSSPSPPRLSREDAVKKAVGILSRAGGGASGGTMEEGERGGRGFRGRGGRGRGGRGMVGRRGGRGGRGRGGFRDADADDDYASGLYLGDNADGERLANKVGVENMDQLTEAFEEMSTRVLPSPMDDAYLDAVHTNNLIEYEPEYLMGDFGTNPDIDDKTPISLRDALEKVKPFLMAYEGIKDHEEWEKVMKETMDKLPVMKELIDIYSGPDRVTAKQQMQELERVAITLPENVPSSVKRYTDRAVLSLQSNPGWGWDKKCQFMDKLVWEVSQQVQIVAQQGPSGQKDLASVFLTIFTSVSIANSGENRLTG